MVLGHTYGAKNARYRSLEGPQKIWSTWGLNPRPSPITTRHSDSVTCKGDALTARPVDQLMQCIVSIVLLLRLGENLGKNAPRWASRDLAASSCTPECLLVPRTMRHAGDEVYGWWETMVWRDGEDTAKNVSFRCRAGTREKVFGVRIRNEPDKHKVSQEKCCAR
jgi:hypothetical protein